jgi:hypothetical protein
MFSGHSLTVVADASSAFADIEAGPVQCQQLGGSPTFTPSRAGLQLPVSANLASRLEQNDFSLGTLYFIIGSAGHARFAFPRWSLTKCANQAMRATILSRQAAPRVPSQVQPIGPHRAQFSRRERLAQSLQPFLECNPTQPQD